MLITCVICKMYSFQVLKMGVVFSGLDEEIMKSGLFK